jgi:hypothetical protein
MLIDNVGCSTRAPLLDGNLDDVHLEFEAQSLGTFRMIRSAAAAARAGGAVGFHEVVADEKTAVRIRGRMGFALNLQG